MIGMVVATMVAFDAAEYVTFTAVAKTFRKLNPKGDNQSMNVQDFIQAAKAKKAQVGTATTSAVQKVKEAVTNVLPVSNHGMQQAIDARTVDILTVIAMVEQRIDFVQEFIGIAEEVPMDARMAVDRVQELMAKFTEKTPAATKHMTVKPHGPAVVQIPAVQPIAAETTATIAKPVRQFDMPKPWDTVAVNSQV
jgi:hypothetical protein